MANNCVWIPDAPNGKQSKLFTDLMNHMGSREDAKLAWGFTKTEFFNYAFPNIEKDANGEPTYKALSEALNLDSILDDIKKDMNKAMDLGLVTSKGKPVVFEDGQLAMSKAEEFNESAKKKVAVVEKTENDKYIARIENNSAMFVAEADKNKARRQLNMALIKLLQKMGFNVEFADDISYNGVFDPLLAEKNATMLRTVIRVANGEQGLEALPEEASHLILAGLKNHPLKQRLDNLVTDDVVRAVLGDRYEQYYDRYKNGSTPIKERLRDEAEGQMLAAMLKGQDIAPALSSQKKTGLKSLLQRIWNFAKSLFSKNISVSDIDNAFSNAQNAILPIKDMLESGDLDTFLDREAIMKAEPLYDLVEENNKLLDKVQEMETNLSKQLYILEQLQTKQPTDELRLQIRGIRESIDNGNYSSACYQAMQAIGNELKKLTDQMKLFASLYDNSTDLETILAESDLVERMKLAIEAYEPLINTMINLPNLIEKGDIDMKPVWADPIVEMAKKYNDLMVNLKANISSMRFSVLKQFLSLYYGINGQKPENIQETDKWKWESIEDVLSHAQKDVSLWDTNLFSAGDSRNLLINIVHNVVVRQQQERNLRIQRLCAQMQETQAKLHKAGYDNSFCVDKDNDGVATGYYKSGRDFARYEKDRKEYAEKVDADESLDYYEKQKAIRKWEYDHTEPVFVGKPDSKGKRRIEYMPKTSVYGVSNWVYEKNGYGYDKSWSKEQREYYNDMLDMKADLDEILPGCYQNLYMMPQVRKSTTQAFDKGGRGFFGTIWHKWRQRYAVVDDNTDYGKTLEYTDMQGKVKELTDMNGIPLKRVPVYFLHKMDDMRDLSTDTARGMFN